MLYENITAVIRAAGERTEKLCFRLLSEQIPEENIHIVNEVPFTKALRKSFEVGIEEAREWTLFIDADVLVAADTVALMLAEAENHDDSVFEIHSNMLDKFFGAVRQGGMKLYRTEFIPKAIGFIPKPEDSIRPEHETLVGMESLGHAWKKTRIVVGLHDHEQYYRDIYRKIFVHAHKHNYLIDSLTPHWQALAAGDMDYRIALLAVQDAQGYTETIKADISQYKQLAQERLSKEGIREKDSLAKAYSSKGIRNLISEVENDPFFDVPKDTDRFRLVASGELGC